jgi:hypothetical protein
MHRRSLVPAPTLAVLLLAAGCGDDPLPAAADADSSSGASTSSAETSSSGTSEGGTAETGNDDSTTTGGASTTSADDTSTDESTTGAPPLVCDESQTRIVGEIGGRPLDGDYMTWGLGNDEYGNRRFFFGTDGALLVYDPGPEPSAAIVGHLRLPAEGPHPASWYCIGEGSELEGSDDGESATASFANVIELGSCPGAAIEGSATLCFYDESCGGEKSFVTAIDDASFEVPLGDGYSGLGEIGAPDRTYGLDFGDTPGGRAAFHAVDVTDVDGTSEIDWGYFTVPAGLPDAGAVYCAAGSLVYEGGELTRVDLTQLSRVGSCADATSDDAVELCFSF